MLYNFLNFGMDEFYGNLGKLSLRMAELWKSGVKLLSLQRIRLRA